ncbi:S-layer family protein, partial [Janthinobacterium agaricidamnosum]
MIISLIVAGLRFAELTGQRFVGDYSSDEQQYRGLMEAGAAYANTWNLRPSVALTPAQMAALTSDIVWLVEQDITLASGLSGKSVAITPGQDNEKGKFEVKTRQDG